MENMIKMPKPGTMTVYQGPTVEGQELTFKMLKTDSRLLRSLMVLHGFSTTEGHNWNMLWTNTAGKPYLYTGLNPY